MRRVAGALLAAAAAGLFAAAGAPGLTGRAAPSPADCAGPVTPAGIPQRPGAALRFGITPGAVAGQLGPPQPAKPEDPAQTMAALAQLRAPGAPFVLRLNRFFWADGQAGIDRFAALARQYADAGFQVELQLRYQPPAGHAGDIAGWTAWVRQVVDRLGPNRGVIGLQVTNEVNITFSPDSSDGAYAGAKDALIQGVIAAHDEAQRHGYDQMRIGFNWAYRTDPNDDQAFWTYLGQHGGARFLAALSWVGLDAYPGTVYPPAEVPGGYRDGMVNALAVLRDCYMPTAGIGTGVPIYVEENGYPTGAGRSEATQLEALSEMVGAVNDFRGTYNVTDYRWFDLRDADSSSPSFQQHFGLLRDQYSPKPAFALYRQLVARLGRAGAGAPGAGPVAGVRPSGAAQRLHLILRDRRGRVRGARCLRPPVTVSLGGAAARRVHGARATVEGRPIAHLRHRRLAWRIGARALPPGARRTLAVRPEPGSATEVLRAHLRACPRGHP